MRAFLLMLFCAGSLSGQGAVSALHRAEATYRSLQTLRADFSQELENPMMGASVISTGTLFLEPPSRFAMRFTEPAGDRIVSDGTWLWLFLPSSVPNQVIRQPIPNRGAATPNLLAQFVDRPLEHYLASNIGSETIMGDVVDVVRLLPRREDDPFSEVDVAIVRSSGLVRRLRIVEPAGQIRTILFENIQTNVEIPKSELEFAVPSGARVVVP